MNIMKEKEIELKIKLNEIWGVALDFGWIPIVSDRPIPNTMIFQSEHFEKHVVNHLPTVLKETYNIDKLFNLTEAEGMQEELLEEANFIYDGLEHIYTDNNCNFVIYATHESATTVGGKELLERLFLIWPEWTKFIWTDTVRE